MSDLSYRDLFAYRALDDQVVVTAMVKARGDRDRLASLRRRGKVFRRDDVYERRNPDVTKRFVFDIERRVKALGPKVNLAIRPKRKKRR